MVQEQEEDIWGQILKEATRKNTDKVESRTVIVLGDRNSGKSSLLARTQNEDITDINKGVALTYTFLDSYEDGNDDPVGRIDFWQLEGEPAHSDLLRLALNESTVANALALIVLDFSQPWTLAATLKKWLGILAEQVKLATSSSKSLEEQLKLYAQTYKDPTPDAANNKKKKKKGPSAVEDPTLLPPLDDTVLTTNLGIPIVVACAKADSVSQLEKDFDYNEGIFEYIQTYLRRICLSYGATLIYTSARKETNCSLLVDYIEHRLFGFELRQRAQLLEKDSIFVPFGWDSMTKIKLDFDNQKACRDMDEQFENVVKKPHFIKRREQTQSAVIAAEDDQAFLVKHKASLDKEITEDKKEKEAKGSGGGLLNTLMKTGPTLPAASSPAQEPVDVLSRLSTPTATPSVTAPVAATTASTTTSAPPSAPTASSEKAVLSQFFTNLMTKDSAKKSLFDPKGGSKSDLEKIKSDLKKGLTTPTKK